jgi:hypothetical protein
MNSPAFKTEILSADETLEHRKVVFESGRSWCCHCCGFEEDCVIAWRPVEGGELTLSCYECHLYEDPMRYKDEVALAYLPVIPKPLLSHILRLTLAMTDTELAAQVADELMGNKANHVERFVGLILTEEFENAGFRKRKEIVEKKVRAALQGELDDVGKKVGHSLEVGRKVFPDTEATLRVLACGSETKIERLVHSLRLVPKNVRWARVMNWGMKFEKAIVAEMVSFAAEYMSVPKEDIEDPFAIEPSIDPNADPDFDFKVGN